ncbi:MAG: hypothetical protein R6V30_02460 [Paracoccaceae bacterium]
MTPMRYRKDVSCFSLSVFLALFAQDAGAQTSDPACDYGSPEAWAEVAASYEGFWVVDHLSGFVIAGATTIPFPADDTSDVLGIDVQPDGTLIATHPDAQEPLVMTWADEPVWIFEKQASDDGVPEPILDSTSVELMMGCPNDQLARLIGTSTAVIDGVQMDFTYRLMVVSPVQMYGIMHVGGAVDGMDFNAWRSVSLTQ